jgi:glycerol-3-phosphate acyltransferase PlsY
MSLFAETGWSLILAGFLLSYLLGSIPFGLLLTRMAGLGDIRAIGSGNIGATNVLRTGNKPLAAATLLLDGVKGTAAVLIAAGSPWPHLALVAAFGAVVGHLFPVWLKFNGGKGVATTLGVWLALAWPVGLAACAVWLISAFLTRLSSLSALIAIAASPLLALWLADVPRAIVGVPVVILVFIRHHENIRRLLSGTESKIGQKK